MGRGAGRACTKRLTARAGQRPDGACVAVRGAHSGSRVQSLRTGGVRTEGGSYGDASLAGVPMGGGRPASPKQSIGMGLLRQMRRLLRRGTGRDGARPAGLASIPAVQTERRAAVVAVDGERREVVREVPLGHALVASDVEASACGRSAGARAAIRARFQRPPQGTIHPTGADCEAGHDAGGNGRQRPLVDATGAPGGLSGGGRSRGEEARKVEIVEGAGGREKRAAGRGRGG